jgi:hypothetical protein
VNSLTLALILILFPFALFAQIASPSFEYSSVGENPATAGARTVGVITAFADYDKNTANIQFEEDGNKFNFIRVTTIKRFQFIYAGARSKIIPEVYFSHNIGERTYSGNDKETTTLNNGFINVAFNIFSRLKFGVKFLKPINERNTSYQSSAAAPTVYYSKTKYKSDILGYGGGAILETIKGLHFGYFYLRQKEKFDYETESGILNGTADDVFKDSRGDEQVYYTKGYGVSWTMGNQRSRAYRFEVSFSRMDPIPQLYGENNLIEPSKRYGAAVEAVYGGFLLGGSIYRTKGAYINFRNYMDYVMADTPSYDEYQNTYSGFFGFNSPRGHSIGISASAYKTNNEKIRTGNGEHKAAVESFGFGLSYAFLF